MKILILVFLLFQISCNKALDDDLTINPYINKKDSLLILKIKNNTNSNLMIEFPTLDNFYYEDELSSSTPEVLYIQKSFDILYDGNDSSIYDNLNCKTVTKLMDSTSILIPKFIKSQGEKKYYFKIKRYRKGKTILFRDDGLSTFEISDSNKKKDFEKIKTQDCSGYKYFKGEFSFYPDKIVLE